MKITLRFSCFHNYLAKKNDTVMTNKMAQNEHIGLVLHLHSIQGVILVWFIRLNRFYKYAFLLLSSA